MGGGPCGSYGKAKREVACAGPERAPNCAPHARTKNSALENDAEQIESVCVSR